MLSQAEKCCLSELTELISVCRQTLAALGEIICTIFHTRSTQCKLMDDASPHDAAKAARVASGRASRCGMLRAQSGFSRQGQFRPATDYDVGAQIQHLLHPVTYHYRRAAYAKPEKIQNCERGVRSLDSNGGLAADPRTRETTTFCHRRRHQRTF
jgi:hypothetical protein